MTNPSINKAEFAIHGVVSKSDGALVVDGRCYAGPLSLGVIFSLARSPTLPAVQVDLRVDEITAYGKDLDQIDEGLTARIKLVGSVPEAIELEGSVLSTG